jgi:DNA-binding transcriptional ArsR family regulator
MKHEPNISAIAALIGDPARANILAALMDGRALTLSELAMSADIGLPTASAHVSKLEDAKLLVSVKRAATGTSASPGKMLPTRWRA